MSNDGFLDFWEMFWNTICSNFAPMGGGLALPTLAVLSSWAGVTPVKSSQVQFKSRIPLHDL